MSPPNPPSPPGDEFPGSDDPRHATTLVATQQPDKALDSQPCQVGKARVEENVEEATIKT